MNRYLTAAAAVLAAALALPANATNIVDEWASVKAPAAPTLKPVTVDAKTTALLASNTIVLEFRRAALMASVHS